MKLPHPQDAFLLGNLFEINSGSQGWTRFMQSLLSHFNARSFHLYVVNNQTQAMRFHVDAGEPVSAEYMTSYVDCYVHKDRLMAAVNERPIGAFYASNLLPDDLGVYDEEYYRQWAVPQGIAEGAVARLYQDGDWTCYMASNRTSEQGPYTTEEIDRLNALIPFIEKAVRASANLAENDKNELRAKALVNTFRFPVAVLSDYGELWAMNPSMQAFLSKQNALLIEDKVLKLADRKKDQSFNLGILQTAKRAAGVSMTVAHAEQIQVLDDCAIGFHALVEPYEHGEVFLGVMVYVTGKGYTAELPPQRLQHLFKLTPAEAEVCELICRGYLPKQIAQLKDKSVYTVREQLSRVFEKTGCSSQVALMNLIANIPL